MSDKPMDFSGLTNPKRVIEKRLAKEESPAEQIAPTPTPENRFTKAFTPEERAKQAQALQLFLQKRGQ